VVTPCVALPGWSIAARVTARGTNGFVERLQGTILTKLCPVILRLTYFTQAVQLK